VRIEFDPAKSERNARQRGLPFDRARDFDWLARSMIGTPAGTIPSHGSWRLAISGSAAFDLLHADRSGVRIISFRKASRREVRYHAEKT